MLTDSDGVGFRPALSNIASFLDRVLKVVESLTLVLSCISLAIIMILVFMDGSLRYLFNSPLPFASDLINLYLISSAFLLVLSYSLRHGSHISVDLFAHMMNNRVQNVLIGAALLCSVPIVGIMAYAVSVSTWGSWDQGEALVGLYPFPVWPSKAIVAVGLIALDLRLLHLGVFNFLAGVTGDETLAYSLVPADANPEEEMI